MVLITIIIIIIIIIMERLLLFADSERIPCNESDWVMWRPLGQRTMSSPVGDTAWNTFSSNYVEDSDEINNVTFADIHGKKAVDAVFVV